MARPFKHPESSSYWFRITVPEDWRARICRTEIRRSLRTRDITQATIREAQLTAEWKSEFEQLRKSIAEERLSEAPAIVDKFFKQLSDDTFGNLDGVIYGIQKLIVTNLLTAWGPEEYRAWQADLALAFMPADKDWCDWQDDLLATVIPESERDALVARDYSTDIRKPSLQASATQSSTFRMVSDGRRFVSTS